VSDCKGTTPPSSGDGGTPADCTTGPCPAACKLVSITVILNATQTNVTGDKNWATVKKTTDDVIVEATTDPNTEACWKQINWSGDSGSPGDKANQRKLSRVDSKKFHVEAELGGVKDHVDVWVIWVDLEVLIGTGDTIDSGNDASGLAAGHKWPAMLGGGKKLGEMTSEGTSLTYAYTVGKIQAKGTLSPSGIEDVVKSGWRMRRKKTKKAYDNGVETDSATDADDTSQSDWLDNDPKSGTSTREIYDLDAPGCSNTLPGTSVTHTAEVYLNFVQYVTVNLDSETQCSDDKKWSYVARVDVDKASGKVEKNTLRLSHVTIPGSPHYSTR
jgi:hypothetical protein